MSSPAPAAQRRALRPFAGVAPPRSAAALPAAAAPVRDPHPRPIPVPAAGAAAGEGRGRAGGHTDGASDTGDTIAVANAALRGGFVQLPRTILHARGLSRDAKLLYAVLLSYAWQEHSCFPGYERLRRDLGCGVNQVTRYMRELEQAELISRRRRGQGKTTVYTLHDLPEDRSQHLGHLERPDPDERRTRGAAVTHRIGETAPAPGQTHQIGETAVTDAVTAQPPLRRLEIESQEHDSGRQQHHVPPAPPSSAPPPALAPVMEPAIGRAADQQVDEARSGVVALLVEQGVTPRIAGELANSHDAEAIRRQIEWHAYRPALARNPAGALVQAIREDWAAPRAWQDEAERREAAQRRAAEEAAHAAEEERRRAEWAARPPEERVRGPLEFWLVGQRRRGREPSAAEIAARRAALIARLTDSGAAPPAPAETAHPGAEGATAPPYQAPAGPARPRGEGGATPLGQVLGTWQTSHRAGARVFGK